MFSGNKYFIIFTSKEFSCRKYFYDSLILLIYYLRIFYLYNKFAKYIYGEFRSYYKSMKIDHVVQKLLKLSFN